MKKIWRLLGMLSLLAIAGPLAAQFSRMRPVKPPVRRDIEQFRESWRVLEPITRRNLTVYPVVSNLRVDTSQFLTLDEGLALGAVKIGERGQMENAMYPRRESRPLRWGERRQDYGGASVNELVLVNDSSRPLILLAGEVVSGGKQNRIIGADLVVPPKSDPLPLTVFCVEHGRWTPGGGAFESGKAMAHPTIRMEAQVTKSQTGVWDSVSRAGLAAGAPPSPTSSYVDVLNSPKAKRDMEDVATSIEADYERELREQLRDRGAVGVVVAISGELVWSDVFSSPDLFRKYWPKLLRSYVMEAEGRGFGAKLVPSPRAAQDFLLEGYGRETVKVEPEAYRRTEISAPDYDIVALEALGRFEDSGLLLHYNKMSRD